VDLIGVVGTSYRTASMDDLAAATLPRELPDESLRELSRLAGFSELVYLGTCNRVEFYFRGESRIHTNPLLFHLRHSLADLTDGSCQLPPEDRLYVHHGRAAARHLFRVTAALDSMMVGEAQIAGQTKEAHERAHSAGLLGGPLDQCFHEAFHLAKRIRNETELARRPVSLVTLVERLLHDHLAATTGPAIIVGAGKMAAQALKLIRGGDPERAVVIANRTPERAARLVARDPHARNLPLHELLAAPPAASLVVAVTASELPVLDAGTLSTIRAGAPAGEPMLVVDLALPTNVDPAARSLPGVIVHGIEQMRDEAERNRQLRRQEVARCEALVEHQMLVLRRRLLDRQLTPAAKALQSSFAEVAQRALEHALARDLDHLDARERRALDRMTRALVKRLVQVPLRGLKAAAWSHSTAVLDKFVRGIEEGFVPEDLAELAEKMESKPEDGA